LLELLINKEKNLKTIMLVENGILLEKHDEHEHQQRLEGNIYLGKVVNVLKGMQTAFVDIGAARHALIKLSDILPKIDITKEQNLQETSIEKEVKVGDNILVQIKKDGTANKGAKLSKHINLPGRFAVLMPNCEIVTVSQKIEDLAEKERLINIAKKVLKPNMGAILRTSSEKISETDIEKDIENLQEKWEKIEKKSKQISETPALIYDNEALIRRTVLDIIDRGLEKIIVNDKKTYENLEAVLSNVKPITVELSEKANLFDMYSLENQIEKTERRKIWLKSGAFITIDRTEALTAIDVNTGKYIGKKDIEETIYNVNYEATIEIAKQVRLRDIGGIIIIDYIDMHIEENKTKIQKFLQECFKKDRAKTQLIGFTKLNLFEMTRKNMCNNDYYGEE